MAWLKIAERITVTYPHFEMTGSIEHDPAQNALAHVDAETGEAEVLSMNLSAYAYVSAPRETFVKDWGEHRGFAEALRVAGIVDIVEAVVVGPFESRAYRVRIL